MKHFLRGAGVALVAAFALTALPARGQGSYVDEALRGKQAPDIKVKDLNNTTRSLAQYRGKTIVLNFAATW